jgi:NADH-quinone oxidoreductase subunit K
MPLFYYLAVSVVLFTIGAAGVTMRRNALVTFMSLEMMYNAANLAFVAFAYYYQTLSGQLFVFFVMTVAAAEVAVGLALMVAIFRTKHSINVDQLSSLKG